MADLEHLDDPGLVAALCGGNEAALAEVYRRYGGAVWAVAQRVCRRQDLAEEVCQVVFTDLWSRPDRYDPERGTLRAWLVTRGRGRAVDAVRSEASRRRREDREARLAPVGGGASVDVESAALDTAGLGDAVRRALAGLPRQQREAVMLTYFGGHTFREAARVLGAPEGTVKSRIRLALGTLRRALASEGLAP
jgi:RNA polymerase sigma-70 factor (ECF subfamily)